MTQNDNSILNLLSTILSGNSRKTLTDISRMKALLTEAKAQTVFPLVYSVLCKDYDLSEYQSDYYGIITNNIKITEEHKKLHKLLCEADIPYVFLKGCASARYYPEPLLRTMGDVDFLVKEEDIAKVAKLLSENSYATQDNFDGIHIEFKSKTSGTTVELHRQINGIPETEIGNEISALFCDIFEKSVLENGEFYRPCDFHHGLVLLLHTASHLTSEGIGLRHLCDWAVFAASFADDEFTKVFEKQLKAVGLWKFAQILTWCAVKYLGCPSKKWIGSCDDAVIDRIIEDVFRGGNFGKKDFSRYQQIKYISDRNSNTIDKNHPLKQVFSNTVAKAKKDLRFVQRYPFLLPVGFVVIIFNYLYLVITKKRKLDTNKVIIHANERKNLYNKFELFKHNHNHR